MTFEDLPIYRAVYKARERMTGEGLAPSSDYWTTTVQGRLDLTRRVLEQVMDADQKLIDIFMRFRKSGSVEGISKAELIVMVAELHGYKCFYANRGRGDCSGDVHLDRIVPESRAGRYTPENCVISCERHNTMRGDKPIEEFLAGGLFG